MAARGLLAQSLEKYILTAIEAQLEPGMDSTFGESGVGIYEDYNLVGMHCAVWSRAISVWGHNVARQLSKLRVDGFGRPQIGGAEGARLDVLADVLNLDKYGIEGHHRIGCFKDRWYASLIGRPTVSGTFGAGGIHTERALEVENVLLPNRVLQSVAMHGSLAKFLVVEDDSSEWSLRLHLEDTGYQILRAKKVGRWVYLLGRTGHKQCAILRYDLSGHIDREFGEQGCFDRARGAVLAPAGRYR